MTNAIVYSYHSSDGLQGSIGYAQLLYSIDSLRKHNQHIPVKVFMSPIGVYETGKIKLPNVEVIEFEASADLRMDHYYSSLWTSHKWRNTYEVLKTQEFDNVLYVDQDTFWQHDPEYIFEKYGDQERIFSKVDCFDAFLPHISLTSPPMNDGINLLSKKTLPYIQDLIDARDNITFEWQEKYRSSMSSDFDLWHVGIQWAACQYAVSEFLASIGKPFIDFDIYDVPMYREYENFSENDKKSAIVLHYMTSNTQKVVPQFYLDLVGYKK